MPDVRLPKNNNFDLLRLLFAITVFVTHLYELSGSIALKIIPQMFAYIFLNSGRAVQGFFVISGYLIFRSYERSTSPIQYFDKRLRRLYPGYCVNILLSAFALSLFSTLPMIAYFLHTEFAMFLLDNLFFLNDRQWTLPGVFQNNKFTAVNGALWTLQIEVMFYITVPIIVLAANRIGQLRTLWSLYVLSIGYICWQESVGNGLAALHFLGELRFFVAGALCYYCFEVVSKHRHLLIVSAIAVFVFDSFIKVPFLLPLALAITVVYIACFVPSLGRVTKYGDFSYAIYIYHFPIVQILVAIQSHWNPVGLLLFASTLIGVAAFLSWNLVEKRFLHGSSHYARLGNTVGGPYPS